MDLFFIFLKNLVPLYVIAGIGWVAGRALHIEKESIAKLLIYGISPIVVFDGASARAFDGSLALIPVIFFLTATILAVLAYVIGARLWKDSTRNVFAFACGAGNTGYFGLPVVLALYGESALPVATAAIMGVILFENTIGFFLTARGGHSVRDSMYKLLGLPAIYTFVLGIVFSIASIHPQAVVGSTFTMFRGAYSVLGMMLIGFALSQTRRSHVDALFISLVSLARFFFWPAMIGFCVFVDSVSTRMLTRDAQSIMILLSFVPVAANTISFATELRVQPEKAVVAVCVSTIIAALVIPIVSLGTVHLIP